MKCPKCGNEVKFLEKHNMYFCESCNKYYYAKAPETKNAEEAIEANSIIVNDVKCEKPMREEIQCPKCKSKNIEHSIFEGLNYYKDCGSGFDCEDTIFKKRISPSEYPYQAGCILGFFFGLIGWAICWCVGMFAKRKDAIKGATKGLILSCILDVIIIVLSLTLGFVL